MRVLETTIDRVKQPEYTGENRCTPCTVLNVVIALCLAIGVGVLSPPAGVIVLVTALLVIYVRGYLIPGTPEITQQYVPEPVLKALGKEPVLSGESSPTAGGDTTAPEEIETLLLDAGVVEETEDNDLRLTASFSEVWWRRIRRYRGSREDAKAQLASVLDIDPSEITFENSDQFAVSYEGNVIGSWASDAAFYADLAVEPTLAEWLPEWENFDDRRRTQLIAGMRALLEECPVCDAELSQVEDVRKSCCSSDFVSVSVDCPECDARVFSGSYR